MANRPPPAPSQLADTDDNSYFCKNCGTRLIHTTPVSYLLVPYRGACVQDICALPNGRFSVLPAPPSVRGYLYSELSISNLPSTARTKESSP